MPIPAHQEAGCPSCVWTGTQEALRPGSPPILVPRLPLAHGGGYQANQVSSQQSPSLFLLWPSHPLAHLPAERPTLWILDSRVSFPLALGCCVHSWCSLCPCWNYLTYCSVFEGSAPGLPGEVCDGRQRAGLAQQQGLWPWEGRRPGICHRHVKGK